jgi:hypothetical protein
MIRRGDLAVQTKKATVEVLEARSGSGKLYKTKRASSVSQGRSFTSTRRENVSQLTQQLPFPGTDPLNPQPHLLPRRPRLMHRLLLLPSTTSKEAHQRPSLLLLLSSSALALDGAAHRARASLLVLLARVRVLLLLIVRPLVLEDVLSRRGALHGAGVVGVRVVSHGTLGGAVSEVATRGDGGDLLRLGTGGGGVIGVGQGRRVVAVLLLLLWVLRLVVEVGVRIRVRV